jgi:hypothetical protein
MVTQFSRNIRAKISTAARAEKKRLLAAAAERTRLRHSINDNLLASSSHCQLALNYDIIDPNLTAKAEEAKAAAAAAWTAVL